MTFKKERGNKPQLGLIPQKPLMLTALARMHGAEKYGDSPGDVPNHTKCTTPTETFVYAAQRHISKFLEGMSWDGPSGQHQLAMAISDLTLALDAMILGHDERWNKEPDHVEKLQKLVDDIMNM